MKLNCDECKKKVSLDKIKRVYWMGPTEFYCPDCWPKHVEQEPDGQYSRKAGSGK